MKRTQTDGVAMVIKTSRLLLTAALLGLSAPAFAQEQFGTPEAAVEALVTAARSEDGAAILKVLGPDGKPIVSSGDPVADTNIRQNFVTAYDAKHTIEMEGDGTQTLVIDNDDWPFPIPLVNKAGQWQFDTKAGRDEILRRRIGRNELSAIQVSLAYVEAQNEYASLDPAGHGRGVYAQRIVSRPGKKDGLIGRAPRMKRPARLASSLHRLQPKATRPAAPRYHIMAITTASSPGKARPLPAGLTTTSPRAR